MELNKAWPTWHFVRQGGGDSWYGASFDKASEFARRLSAKHRTTVDMYLVAADGAWSAAQYVDGRHVRQSCRKWLSGKAGREV